MPIENLDAVEALVSEIVNDVIKPSVYLRIVKMTLPNEAGMAVPIIKLDIPKSLFVHKSPGGYFHRLGDKKRELSPEALARLFQQRSQVRIIRFDEQPVPMTSIADLHEPLWRRFTGDLDEPAEVTLEKLKLISKDDLGAQRMTVAGALMATIRPEVYLPNAFIEAAAYRGDRLDSNYQIDARAIKGPLDQQVREAVAFVRKNMKVAAYKAPGRVEIPQFSIRAVFESIVNAVAHRDYSFQGSKIRLFIFEDRLEIFSPGTIPNSMTLESMALRQSTRNELITTLISRCPVDAENSEIGRQYMMEKRGEGVPIIFSETLRLTAKMPIYRLLDESELMLTIPAATAAAWGQSPQAGG
jgi:predicted HTH transcriptional regulator